MGVLYAALRRRTYFCLAISFASGLASAQTYRLTDLGTPEGTYYSFGISINSSGQAIGVAYAPDWVAPRAFLWDGTGIQALGALGGTWSYGSSINEAGQVAGYATTSGDSDYHVILWSGTEVQDLGLLGGHYFVQPAVNASGQVAYVAGSTDRASLWNGTSTRDLGTLGGWSDVVSINDDGKVAGVSETAIPASHVNAIHAFLWDGTAMLDLGTLGGAHSWASDINKSGQVTGWSDTADYGVHAFVFNDTGMQDLGTLGGTWSQGYAINDSGQVTGWSYTASYARHAFLWDGSEMRDLGAPGDGDSVGWAINASGQVTGYFFAADWTQRAFISDGGLMQDLNSLIDPDDPLKPWVILSQGVDINDRGQILANGCDTRTWTCHAYIASPPLSVEDMIAALLNKATGVGPGASLQRKMTQAQSYYAVSRVQSACGVLGAFINEATAQSGRQVDPATAGKLIADARAIRVALKCR
jgi:probable HAF family extracellular repeat protein